MRLLTAELPGSDALINSVCPRWVATAIGGGGARLLSNDAASVCRAALLPDDTPPGGFFGDGTMVAWSGKAGGA